MKRITLNPIIIILINVIAPSMYIFLNGKYLMFFLFLYMVSGLSGVLFGSFGTIIPSYFFLESYRSEWISRGQTPETMDDLIKWTSGTLGIISTVVVFTLSVIGAYIGHLILKKHFEKKEAKTSQAA